MTPTGLHKKSDSSGELEPLAIGIKDLARLLGVSAATVERRDAAGLLGPVPIKWGYRKLWRLSEIRAWVESGMVNRQTWLALNRANHVRGGETCSHAM
jgi:predicted DNA-binding transcriptional regulator AlpA